MFRKPLSHTLPLSAIVLFSLLASCSQAPVNEALPLVTGELTTAATVPPQGTRPAHIRWQGGSLTLEGCAWRGVDRKASAFRSLYLETARPPGHLMVYDGRRDRYFVFPERGGQSYWRNASSSLWFTFRRVEPFSLPPKKFTYTAFSGTDYQRSLCPGKHVSLLLAPRPTRELLTTARVVPALDAAYEVYHSFTKREPQPHRLVYNRLPIAEIPDGGTCGAGCGYLGFTGIEITSPFVDSLIGGISARNEYDQVVFYELGRNFWFYGEQLGALDPFVTGFAIAGRFISLKEAGLQGSPFNGLAFATFRKAVTDDLLVTFLADDNLTWRNTLGEGRAPPNPYQLSASDLAGAMFWQVYRDYGLAGLTRFFTELYARPYAATPKRAVTNFVAAAYAATGKDYRYLFKDGSLRLR